jgi:hypothetical protein
MTPSPKCCRVRSNVPYQDGSCHHLQNQILQRSQQQHLHICLLAVQPYQPRHIKAGNSSHEGHNSSHQQRRTTYQERRNRHALDQIRCCHGNGFRQLLSLPHHDDWSLVQQRFFTIHPKTGQTIQPQCFQKNDQTHVPSAHLNVHNFFSFSSQPEAKEQPQQCQDKKEHRWQHDLTSQASFFYALELSQPRCTDHGTQISQLLFSVIFAQWDSDLLG